MKYKSENFYHVGKQLGTHFKKTYRMLIVLSCIFSCVAAKNDLTEVFTGLSNVHGIHEVICPDSDSGYTIILNMDSFRNINKHEFNLMKTKCESNGSHIETDGQIGIEQDPRKRKSIYLIIGLSRNDSRQKILFLEYSSRVEKYYAKEIYRINEEGGRLLVSKDSLKKNIRHHP